MLRERSEKMWEPSRCQGQWRRRGWQWSRCQREDSLAAPGENCSDAAPGGSQQRRYPPTDHWGSHTRAGGCVQSRLWPHGEPVLEQAPGRSCSLWRGTNTGAGFLTEAVTCGQPLMEQPILEGLYPMESIHTEAVLKVPYPEAPFPTWLHCSEREEIRE